MWRRDERGPLVDRNRSTRTIDDQGAGCLVCPEDHLEPGRIDRGDDLAVGNEPPDHRFSTGVDPIIGNEGPSWPIAGLDRQSRGPVDSDSH